MAAITASRQLGNIYYLISREAVNRYPEFGKQRELPQPTGPTKVRQLRGVTQVWSLLAVVRGCKYVEWSWLGIGGHHAICRCIMPAGAPRPDTALIIVTFGEQ